jgi:hypothetical protein
VWVAYKEDGALIVGRKGTRLEWDSRWGSLGSEAHLASMSFPATSTVPRLLFYHEDACNDSAAHHHL